MTNEIKQTAVDYFEYELTKLDFNKITQENCWFYIIPIFEKAKEMEKKQIEKAFANGVDDEYEWHINNQPRTNSEQYYNETYGGNK